MHPDIHFKNDIVLIVCRATGMEDDPKLTLDIQWRIQRFCVGGGGFNPVSWVTISCTEDVVAVHGL